MTDPRKYLIRMIMFIIVVFAIVIILNKPLIDAFNANTAINGLISVILLIGVLFLCRQTIRLVPEKKWIENIQDQNKSPTEPVLLAPLAYMLGKETSLINFSISAAALRSVLDGVAGRLDENREIARYLIGLLIFLGLLGTFWGLIGTVSSVSNVISGLNFGNQETSLVFSNLQKGLETPLEGMSTAFSSSLFGLAGSLILGLLDLQLGQASGRFYQDLENWLSSSVKISNNQLSNSFTNENISYSDSLTESSALHLSELASALTTIEADRSRLLHQITELNTQLRRLADQIENENSIQKKLPVIEAQLQSISEEARNNYSSQIDIIKQETRSLGNSIKKSKAQEGNKHKNIKLRAD
ncbi:MAG: biopolymer transporter ExbB [SAR116 cluster bacterium]|nr:biopolymer transporter ExbB [SAR116 cluster bacterium]